MSRATSRITVVVMATLLATGWLSVRPQPALAAGSISLAAMNTAYTQSFNTLGSAGTFNASTLPTGWEMAESGTAANSIYTAGTGSSATGDTYSFGSFAIPLDRAFGALRSNALSPITGASFTNNTGATISKLDVAYTGEMWRAGVASRMAADRIDFQLSTNAIGLTSGTWTDYDALDYSSTNTNTTSSTTLAAKDGNNAAFRTALTFEITGLSIANGATFWIRWTDFDIASSDDGLAVDDFSLTPRPGNDTAPSVTATSPANGAENVANDANVTINFSEPVALADGWFSIVCTQSGARTANVSGGPTTWTLDVDGTLTDVEYCTVTIDHTKVADVDPDDPPDAMAADAAFSFQVGPECDDTLTPVYSIQGSGANAATTGVVDTEGVVVGDFEGAAAASGFYIQDPTGDGDAATSDGIFVFTGNANLVSAGDYVRVRGFARERFNQTTINGSNANGAAVTNVLICGTGTVASTDVTLPFASPTFAERYEGMSVRFTQSLVISEYFNYARFGEIVLALPLAGEDRPFTGTAIDAPGAAAIARNLANSLRRITLDDGVATQNPDLLRHPNGDKFTLENLFRGGDNVQNAAGVLGWDFNLYRIFPTAPADYTQVNPRPEKVEDVGGSVKIAAMNTLNFFVTADIDPTGPGDNVCGGNANLECRGWDSNQPLELSRQRDKLVQALYGLNADVLGLNELENRPGTDAIGDPTGILAALNALYDGPDPEYAFINTGTIGTDAIRVGMIYKPGVVTPVGDFKVLTSAVDPRFIDTKSRPALAQTFYVNETGARFTVVVNHLKSKGSDCLDIDLDPGAGVDPDNDTGDGQGNCNGTRALAAQALVDWLATDPTNSGDPDFAIMGDLNSYAMEDPITAIKAGADGIPGNGDDYTNLIAMEQGTYAYSYTFDGMAGYLDHAIGNASFTDQVTGAAEWHINSDEPTVLDYDTTFKGPGQDALYEPNQYRTSDHDPVLVGLDLLNATPTFESVVAASCASGAGGSFNVTIDDYDLLETELTLALSDNTNTTLVPNANAVVTGTGASRAIAITAAGDEIGTAVLTFTLSDGWNEVPLVITVKVGTNSSDTLAGTAGNDILIGLGGDDALTSLGSADILCSGKGEDDLSGGDGDDLLEAGGGEDDLDGGAGADRLRGGVGEDRLTGGEDGDSFSGGGGSDVNTDFDAGEGDTSDGS